MKIDAFLTRRREGWRQLSTLLDRLARAGPAALTTDELDSVGRLYRRAASDLAYARAHFDDAETLSYLNQLVARGHAAIYAPPRPRWNRLWRFFTADFPRRVRAAALPCLLAGLLLFGSAAIAGAIAAIAPERAVLFVPEQFASLLEDPSAHQFPKGDTPAGLEALLGSMILTNNIQVGFLAFALGISFGLGTVWVLVQNGMMLGALSGVLGRGESGPLFWSLIAPHGGMELIAICLCGAAGLLLGSALIAPGDYRRRDALILAGRRALPLVAGAAPIFGVAALVEAFLTPAEAPIWLKLSVGAAGAGAVLLYLTAAGHTAEATRAR